MRNIGRMERVEAGVVVRQNFPQLLAEAFLVKGVQ